MAHLIANSVGVSGTFLCLLAYCLLQLDKWRSDSFCFLSVNLLGALCIMFSLYYFFNLASLLMEIAWSTISLYGLVRWYARRKARQRPDGTTG